MRVKKKHKNTNTRRREIILAALSCFNEFGYSETSIESIRLRSFASTGSIYHHFGNKEHLAMEVYAEGLRDYQTGLLVSIEKCELAKDGIYSLISYHLKWVEANKEWAKFLFKMRHEHFMIPGEDVLERINEDFFKRIIKWFKKHVVNGVIRPLPPDLYVPILLGPCHEFAKYYLKGATKTSINAAINEFAIAAWTQLNADGNENIKTKQSQQPTKKRRQ